MKHRPHHERHTREREDSEEKKPIIMHTGHVHNRPENGSGECPSASLSAHLTRLPGDAACSSGDVRIELDSAQADHGERPSASCPRPGSQPQGRHSQAHARVPPSSEARHAEDGDLDPGEHSSSASELRLVFQWLQKSLPYILILCAKLIVQHAVGISVGIGLLTTFLYANKSLVNQVFLRERGSKLQCVWLLVFLGSSSVLLYYTFYVQSLYYSLIFFNPVVDSPTFWDVLWIVGITDFILKFLFMGFKCLVLLVPSFLMSCRSKGYWFMFLEELGQYYRLLTPVPVWFRYLIGTRELESFMGWSLGILLALFYLIVKLLGFFAQWKTFRKVLQVCCTRPLFLFHGSCLPEYSHSLFFSSNMELLPARDNVLKLMISVPSARLNLEIQLFLSASTSSVKTASRCGLIERGHVLSAGRSFQSVFISGKMEAPPCTFRFTD
ncbi:E3 ubiquitin-protein ligase RNFT1 isoform X2 [Rhinatrema bivittatum]|uniref:E3 ubiquitin-protein ligase RNFT1 isoform X2 n=1 Tax=Rhinatrema bivittatum TaxID=194408 RepID=UPI00112C2116|nr:E3 ubiquitin-protein ligase RNFT1 isoform X2 [Rhinatrema bivittatum]XP_029467644.1 E3 ubiquitin-protein ligase RNFT1 isoform X2 [Rhinatrema bivittatum]